MFALGGVAGWWFQALFYWAVCLDPRPLEKLRFSLPPRQRGGEATPLLIGLSAWFHAPTGKASLFLRPLASEGETLAL